MKHIKTISIIACVLIMSMALIAYLNKRSLENIDENNLPKIIQADWIDLGRIGSISKFRSGSGHDFSGSGEACRSMKHYFNPVRTEEDQKLIDQSNGFPPPFSLEGAIPIYSPVDGEIKSVGKEETIGKQIHIRPEKYPNFTIRLFHIYLLDGYEEGRKVSAGEKIGHIGRIQNTDIAINIGGLYKHKFVSYFQVMPDELFVKYQAAGVESREQLIIAREYRDAHPLECNGEWFAVNHDATADEFVFINGHAF